MKMNLNILKIELSKTAISYIEKLKKINRTLH